MAKLTLLEIVQSVLNATGGDEVNDVSASAESESVALVAKEVYEQLMSDSDWPHLNVVTELDGVSDVLRPMILRVPDNLAEIDDIKYDITKITDPNTKIKDIRFLESYDFLSMVHSRNTSQANINTYSINNVPLFIINDKAPSFWTTFDDEVIIFDSYDSSEDTTLQASKSIVLAKKEATWTASNTFVPDLPSKNFPQYLARVKAKYFAYDKETNSPLDLEEANRGKNRQKRRPSRTEETIRRPNYGRSRRGRG